MKNTEPNRERDAHKHRLERFRREGSLHKNWPSQILRHPDTDLSHHEDKFLSWPCCVSGHRVIVQRQLSYSDMNIESNRLTSFHTERWAKFDLSFIYRLANAGLYSSGEADEVQCFSCLVRIKDWTPDDSPKRRHKRTSPKCRFVNGVDRRNIADIHYVKDTPESEERSEDSDNCPSASDENVRGEPQEDIIAKRFHSERNRLMSFREWPYSIPVDPYELASGGFFVIPGTTTVQCFACFGRISASNWRIGDRPMYKHSRHFPSCPFVLGKDTGNVILDDGDRAEALYHNIHQKAAPLPKTAIHPKYPQFAAKDFRVASFENWRITNRVSPGALADAGFFYSNDEDRVTCFCCGCRLEKWVVGDDPWEEHQKWSPDCAWLGERRQRDAFVGCG